MREAISAKQRLAITLRYLTTGDAHSTIAASYMMSPTTVGLYSKRVRHFVKDSMKPGG